MNQAEFLEFVLGSPEEVTIEKWPEIGVRRQVHKTVEQIRTSGIEGTNVFFYVSGTCIASDTDGREVSLPPSCVTETSKGRRNSFWILSEPVTATQSEVLVSYLDPFSPPCGAGRSYRVPGTISSKHGGSPFTCRIIEDSGKVYSAAQIYALNPPEVVVPSLDLAWVDPDNPPICDLADAIRFMAAKGVTKTTITAASKPTTNAKNMLMSLLKDSKMDEREAIWCLSVLPCNPYRKWRYGVHEELAKMLLVERATHVSSSMERVISNLRAEKDKTKKPFEVRSVVSKRVVLDFEVQTSILHATDGTMWAVDKHTGLAMELARNSSPISYFINSRYGINPVDIDHRHVIEDLMAQASKRPPTAESTAISHFERDRQRMLVSFGGREVAVLTSKGVSYQDNGLDGVIFRPVRGASVVATRLLDVRRALEEEPGIWWGREFLPPSALSNLVRGDPEQLSVLLHVWTVFFFFRNVAGSRPILAMLGPAGSGKTSLSKKLQMLLYGRSVKLFGISTVDAWDTTTSNYPLALFDNVDTPTPWWLAPKLAISISPFDSPKRALFTNNDAYVRRCDAMVGVSSHDASFLKDDIIDRMILMQFQRIADEDRLEEDDLILGVEQNRERYLACLMADVVRVLGTPRPKIVGSAIRVVDFAAIGKWIAKALGVEDTFLSALGDLAVHQKSRVLEEDAILVAALQELQEISPLATDWITAAALWMELLSFSDDNGRTLERLYKGPQALARKIAAIYGQLNKAIGIEQKDDEQYGWPCYRLHNPDLD